MNYAPDAGSGLILNRYKMGLNSCAQANAFIASV
jgi:hypothetical protein